MAGWNKKTATCDEVAVWQERVVIFFEGKKVKP